MRKFIDIITENAEDWDSLYREAARLGRERPSSPRPQDLALFDKMREVIRHDEGLGGQCHEMAQMLWDLYGWEGVSGTYLAPNGEPACSNHFWNNLPDGSILDTTADQLGEDGRTIRIIHPDDPQWRRYTSEWHEDWHPEHPDYDSSWDMEKRDTALYSGKPDMDRENDIRAEHGGDRYWYVGADRSHVDAYRDKERKYQDE